MEERQVTIGEETYPLPEPFFVLATQNPIEHEGTYPLPEAEVDRFLLKIKLDYPKPDDELKIIKDNAAFDEKERSAASTLSPLLNYHAILELRKAAELIHVDEKVADYIVRTVQATRPPNAAVTDKGKEGIYRYIAVGASPRAGIALYKCARITALLRGKTFVAPEDVKKAAPSVLRHRLTLSYEAEANGLDADAIAAKILSLVPVP
jgi:MoxR-like ATPase